MCVRKSIRNCCYKWDVKRTRDHKLFNQCKVAKEIRFVFNLCQRTRNSDQLSLSKSSSIRVARTLDQIRHWVWTTETWKFTKSGYKQPHAQRYTNHSNCNNLFAWKIKFSMQNENWGHLKTTVKSWCPLRTWMDKNNQLHILPLVQQTANFKTDFLNHEFYKYKPHTYCFIDLKPNISPSWRNISP